MLSRKLTDTFKQLTLALRRTNKAGNANARPLLHLAAENGNVKAINRLVRKGADVHEADDAGLTALHLAAYYNQSEAVLALINAGANIHATDMNGQTPLHHAASGGHMEMYELLLAQGARSDMADKAGWTANQLKPGICRGNPSGKTMGAQYMFRPRRSPL